MKHNLIAKISLISLLILLLFPIITQALTPGEELRCMGSDCGTLFLEGKANTFKLCCYIYTASRWLYIIAMALAVIVVIIGGITYMTAGGKEEQTSKAKKIIVNGLIGTTIVILSAVIINSLYWFLF